MALWQAQSDNSAEMTAHSMENEYHVLSDENIDDCCKSCCQLRLEQRLWIKKNVYYAGFTPSTCVNLGDTNEEIQHEVKVTPRFLV